MVNSPFNWRNLSEKKWDLFLISVGLLIVYSLFIFLPFGASDDFDRTYWYLRTPDSFNLSLLKSSMLDGRTLNGIFLYLFFKPTNISSLGLYRILNVILLVGFAALTYLFLSRRLNRWAALTAAMVLCLLPSYLSVLFFTSLMGVIGGGILAALSAIVLSGVWENQAIVQRVGRIFGAACLLLAAAQFYQPIAMVYWVFVLIDLSSDPGNGILIVIKKYGAYLANFLIAMATSVLIIRSMPALLGIQNNRTSMIGLSDILPKVEWFLTSPLVQSTNILLVDKNHHKVFLAFVVILFIGFVIWLEGKLLSRALKMLLVISLIPLAYAPNLVVTENWPSYRSMIALSSMWVILTLFAYLGYRKILVRYIPRWGTIERVSFVGVGLLAIVISSYHTISYLVLPVYTEHQLVSFEFTRLAPKAGDHLYLIQANYNDSASPYVYGDEFGFPITGSDWGCEGLINVVAIEKGFLPGQLPAKCVREAKNIPEAHPLIINLRDQFDKQLIVSQFPLEVSQKSDR